MKKYLIFVALFVAGCAKSPQEQCKNIGYSQGTSEFQQCVMTIHQEQQQVLQMYMGNLQAQQAQQNANSQIFQKNLNAAAANSVRRPMQTNCYQAGNSINCSSY